MIQQVYNDLRYMYVLFIGEAFSWYSEDYCHTDPHTGVLHP